MYYLYKSYIEHTEPFDIDKTVLFAHKTLFCVCIINYRAHCLRLTSPETLYTGVLC